MRVKIIRNHKNHVKGQIEEVSPNVGFGLIDSGVAIVSKDIAEPETKTKGVGDGRTAKLRTHRR